MEDKRISEAQEDTGNTLPVVSSEDRATREPQEPLRNIEASVNRAVDAWWDRVRSKQALSRHTAAHNLIHKELVVLKETLNRELGK